MQKQKIDTNKAPAAIGPYSQAIKAGNLLFCSGQIGVDPKTDVLVVGGIKKQAIRAFENIKEVLKEAKASFKDVVKVNVYLKNMDDFAEMNKIYATYFSKPYPARATVEVARLPKGALIEIELLAHFNKRNECCDDCDCC